MSTVHVDLGQLYRDCHHRKAMATKTKERSATVERMVAVLAAVRDGDHTVELHLGDLVGAMTQDGIALTKAAEIRRALQETLRALERATTTDGAD